MLVVEAFYSVGESRMLRGLLVLAGKHGIYRITLTKLCGRRRNEPFA
jgi:hypothetical protein